MAIKISNLIGVLTTNFSKNIYPKNEIAWEVSKINQKIEFVEFLKNVNI